MIIRLGQRAGTSPVMVVDTTMNVIDITTTMFFATRILHVVLQQQINHVQVNPLKL